VEDLELPAARKDEPMSNDAYGIREARVDKDALDVHVQEIELLGFTVLDSVITDERLSLWRQSLDGILHRQAAEAGGPDALRAIGEENTARAMLAYDETFLNIANHPLLIELCRRLLGDYFILMQQNGIINQPTEAAHHQAAYHRDLPYQHFVSSRPLAISALFCLDPFEPDNGSTVVLPGSHKSELFPSQGYVRKMERPVHALAGSFIVFDSMLFHRAGLNRSQAVRRAVNNVYALPFLKQQIVLPALLGGKWADDPSLCRLLGYESDPAPSPAAFRARRARQS
jgi:hypothetical protein